MSHNEEKLNNVIEGSNREETEPESEKLTYEEVEERIKINLEPVNEQISNITKLL